MKQLKKVISMKIKNKKLFIVLTVVAVILIISAALLLGKYDKKYTLEVRVMPGATAIDGESYIEFADLGTVDFYTFFFHYIRPSDVQDNYGALDIVYYYSEDSGYVGSGTKIDCEVIETNKKQAVLHYSGVGVDEDGKLTEVDDYWSVNMNDLWNGRYTEVSIIQFE